jgi:hypothetical protein
MQTLYGCEVLSQRVIYEQGCFRRTRYWLRGHVRPFDIYGRYIWGMTGPETVIDVETIRPAAVFDVSDPQQPGLSA